ncbi:hypothetical protein DFO61_3351 [Ectopseudomonas oleovorans]|uniref:Uncharacterized protein n=1 Tax=Ectopseudomonas oleovorans TaxID=301 RepID=A0A397MLY0_ECTOL|nr:hypothetical protein [Pseudomonas oleovorans]RIA22661.1 hypothetical protein DFO61_3351 [Pseudomonas oleovorans]
MAKQYIVKTTIHGIPKAGGKKVVIRSSPEPQDVPAALVKELLERGVIEEVGALEKGKAAADSTPAGGVDGTGDDNSGD